MTILTTHQAMPDISLTDNAPIATPLRWVGMEGIDLPVGLEEPGCEPRVHARVDAQVDLPTPQIKGIHMSRLYRLLDRLTAPAALTSRALHQLLVAMVASHEDCNSTSARIQLRFDLLIRRPALVTPGLAGWTCYPVMLEATLKEGRFSLTTEVEVTYSSTCPCSAALSRQLIAEGFTEAFKGQETVSPAAVNAWLQQNATLATPHSQRSKARVMVTPPINGRSLGLVRLIDRIEQALGTPVQTAVKRADEQAFAALNGANLMFVEDAARRIASALQGEYGKPQVKVRHIESLHPHDAVAQA
ncbi:MAG: GTP cyclohydrolase I FolE2 [Oceanospirillaceae bacterium]|nr:GTP cyclohydrolase I FolE2 [Oceanospirillaceae bacterium]